MCASVVAGGDAPPVLQLGEQVTLICIALALRAPEADIGSNTAGGSDCGCQMAAILVAKSGTIAVEFSRVDATEERILHAAVR